MELFSQVVIMGGWLLSVLVKEGSKGTFSIAAKLGSSTCAHRQMSRCTLRVVAAGRSTCSDCGYHRDC